MTTSPSARTLKQRKQDTLHRLENDVDAWVATAAEHGGAPCLVPLSFVWDGTTLLISTPADSPTGRNLSSTRSVRLGIGRTRDVVMVEGTATAVTPADLAEEDAEIFAAKTGFDPRELPTPYLYFYIRPHRIQAWREANELKGRELMRDGKWLVAD
ncbi:pyridoxamine 5'-phosphate oxidase family protein [Streptomyces sp. XM83C]|uniref:Pyridoxamine 5'-phosphate oxidase family protein n=1 Tax=Streptomyces thermocoprophilus TaxID=78356 RepID=A0ABV5V7D9_9ACTN|nr:pyridoxamine 5'-phosphate oxidase family protein [Streptomyces sp. XM83C]MCK1819708.1 pyridoxamine 5'-phosphate oxidase family protein [Streptomyces sp. XM83C]